MYFGVVYYASLALSLDSFFSFRMRLLYYVCARLYAYNNCYIY